MPRQFGPGPVRTGGCLSQCGFDIAGPLQLFPFLFSFSLSRSVFFFRYATRSASIFRFNSTEILTIRCLLRLNSPSSIWAFGALPGNDLYIGEKPKYLCDSLCRFRVNSQGSKSGRFWEKSLGYSPWFWTWRILVSPGNSSKLSETSPKPFQKWFLTPRATVCVDFDWIRKGWNLAVFAQKA